MTYDLTNPIYHDENKARAHFQALRWSNGVVCSHCGTMDNATEMKGATTRPGLFKCREKECRKPFTATMGTLYERSHIPLHKWLLATHLMCASKKGVSALQLHRMLGFGSYRTAWFMAHRIREAMRVPSPDPLGGPGKVVEVDETYVGGREANKHAKDRKFPLGHGGKEAVVTIVERNGEARSFHVANVTSKTLRPIIVKNASRKSHLMTDGSRIYPKIGEEFAAHSMVEHSVGEYVREGFHHSNTAESYFAILKRGVYGSFHSVSEAHLGRYLTEFDFRYNNRAALGVTDAMRTTKAIEGVVGKRLMYRQPDQAA